MKTTDRNSATHAPERSADPIMGSKGERRRAQFELLQSLVNREMRGRYRDSFLGSAWTLIQPIVMTGVYYFLFSFLFPNNTIENYPFFIVTGLILWNFYANCLILGTTAITGSSNIVRKVWFRRELLPMSVVTANAITTLALLAVIIPADAIASPSAWKTVILVPIFFGLLAILCFGLACILATLNVFYRDISHLITVVTLPLFFMTPVFYSLNDFPRQPPYWVISLLRYGNPVTPYIESIRALALQGVVPGVTLVVYCIVVAPAVAIFGVWLLRRNDDKLAVEV